MKNLVEAMQSLYETGDYYVRVNSEESVEYEENYWGEIIDPDGKKRVLVEEKDQQVDDIKHVLEFINQQPPGKMLDVGCGLGWLLSAVGDSWEKHGIEISTYAAQHASKYGSIHIGTLSNCPYTENAFDIVTMYHVIEHVDDPEANLKLMKKYLKREGMLIIGTPDFDSGCARRFGQNYRLLDPSHIRLFSNDSMHRFLRDHEFHIFKTEYPFFETRYFIEENLLRLFDASNVSPPFYGNYMTFFCRNL